MMILKFAFRNLLSAGLRTWLNVIVLSLSFFLVVWYRGVLDGWNLQAQRDMINWEIGGGQYWQDKYDPYDPFSLDISHSPIPGKMKELQEKGLITPILVTQGTIYVEGRIQSVLLKGIDPEQGILKLPTKSLDTVTDEIPVIIGTGMAKNSNLKKGDLFTIRWRDKNGTFDADEAKVINIYKTNVPTVDVGQVWIPLNKLQGMIQTPGEASIAILAENSKINSNIEGWKLKTLNFLLADIKQIIKTKSFGGAIMYILLLLIALLAIFDTQVLSVFKRQKEIGTYMALGMTRGQVIALFTAEGGMHSIMAAVVAAIYGIPLLILQAIHGFAIPYDSSKVGIVMAEKIYPYYSIGLIIGTALFVFIITTFVSYLPVRKIAKLKPTEAIKGKLQ